MAERGALARSGWPLRAARLIADIRGGELVTATLMLVNLLVLLVAYYVLKTVREPLILADGSAELRSYAAGFQAAALVGFLPLYSWLASRVSRLPLVLGLVGFYVLGLLVFHVLGVSGFGKGARLGFAFFVWLGVFSVSVIAQFWSFANDLYSTGAGERVFPFIAIGATVGSPLGSKVAGFLIDAGLSPYAMMLVAAGLLVLHGGLSVLVHRRERHRRPEDPPAAPLPAGDGFGLVLRSGYLRLIAGLLIVLNLVNTIGEYILSKYVSDWADAAVALDPALSRGALIGGFYADFYFWVNVAAMTLQALAVSRIVKRFGLTGVLFALPIVSAAAWGFVAAGAGFALLAVTKTAENATDYSVMNTAKAMLWLPTSRAEKFKGKQAVDTFFVRLGDMLAAGLVYLGAAVLQLPVRAFAGINLGLVVVWGGVAAALARRNRALRNGDDSATSPTRGASSASPAGPSRTRPEPAPTR